MDIQRFPKLNRKKLYNCLLSRALRALDNRRGCHPLFVRREAPHNQRIQRSAGHASKLACPSAADPRRLVATRGCMIECVKGGKTTTYYTWRVPVSTLGWHACCALCSGYEAHPTMYRIGRRPRGGLPSGNPVTSPEAISGRHYRKACCRRDRMEKLEEANAAGKSGG